MTAEDEKQPDLDQVRAMIAQARITMTRDPALGGRRALAAYRAAREAGDSWLEAEARQLIYKSIPKYHAQVATDPVRLAAWEAALAAVIRPEMHVLEVGVGCGILAMLACRAGAAQVTGCDSDPVIVDIAEEMVAKNGLSDRINLIAKPVSALSLPGDLDRQADLLILDLFADNLFPMRPFERVREALPLLAPGATVIPRRAELRGALAWSPKRRRSYPTKAAGFDMTALIAAAPLSVPGDGATLCHESQSFVDAAIPHAMPGDAGESVVELVSKGGPVNGVMLWIRLELAEGHVIDAAPGAERRSHATPRYYPLPTEWEARPGERVPIRLRWDKRLVSVERLPG